MARRPHTPERGALYESVPRGIGADFQVFTLPEIAKRSGVEYRTLHNWQRRGLIKPSVKASRGNGNAALFTGRDAEVACALAELRRRGASMDGLTMAALALQKNDETPCPCCSTQLLLSDLQPADHQEGEHRG